jgi:hypothetical protein
VNQSTKLNSKQQAPSQRSGAFFCHFIRVCYPNHKSQNWHAFCISLSNTKQSFGNTQKEMHMNAAKQKKALHPWKQFLIEILTARAGLYVKQDHPRG